MVGRISMGISWRYVVISKETILGKNGQKKKKVYIAT
jgi:hypothetical protein